jgi:hypothetical protein
VAPKLIARSFHATIWEKGWQITDVLVERYILMV